MAEVRPMRNDEAGLFFPTRELLDPQAKETRRLAGEYLMALQDSGEIPTNRPLVVRLEDGLTSVQHFTLHSNISENWHS